MYRTGFKRDYASAVTGYDPGGGGRGGRTGGGGGSGDGRLEAEKRDSRAKVSSEV